MDRAQGGRAASNLRVRRVLVLEKLEKDCAAARTHRTLRLTNARLLALHRVLAAFSVFR